MEKNIESDMASFFVDCTGQVEKAEFLNTNGLYCQYSFQFGPDWSIEAGIDHGLSQMSKCKGLGYDSSIVWNFPIDIKFKSTNPFGWPRIAVSVHGTDFFGRDIPYGYGSVLVPLTTGQHTVDVNVYIPLPSSILTEWASWFWGDPPEFVCQSDGREVTRVRSTGTVRLKLNIVTKGMEAAGYASREGAQTSSIGIISS